MCQLLAAAPHTDQWSLQATGVVALVKDNNRCSYFIRLFDIYAQKMLFEEQLCVQSVVFHFAYLCRTLCERAGTTIFK